MTAPVGRKPGMRLGSRLATSLILLLIYGGAVLSDRSIAALNLAMRGASAAPPLPLFEILGGGLALLLGGIWLPVLLARRR